MTVLQVAIYSVVYVTKKDYIFKQEDGQCGTDKFAEEGLQQKWPYEKQKIDTISKFKMSAVTV